MVVTVAIACCHPVLTDHKAMEAGRPFLVSVAVTTDRVSVGGQLYLAPVVAVAPEASRYGEQAV